LLQLHDAFGDKDIFIQINIMKEARKSIDLACRNLSLGLTTKARACKGVGQE
jgi:hypothetical protein